MAKGVVEKKAGFPIPKSNYRMILIGFGIVIVGYILMIGGGSDSPDTFNYAIFGFRRITLAPLVILFGFGFIFWAIMRKPKDRGEKSVENIGKR